MLKCINCGSLLEEEDLKTEIDRDTLEPYGFCPFCDSDEIIEVKECDECGCYFSEEGLHGYDHQVCIGCISKRRHDLDFCKAVGDEEQDQVSLNGFLLEMFDEDEIEEILLRELKDRHKIKQIDGMHFLIGCLDSAADVLASS